jgi:hypothetical protein
MVPGVFGGDGEDVTPYIRQEVMGFKEGKRKGM